MRTALLLAGLIGSLLFAARGPLGLTSSRAEAPQTSYYGNGKLRSSICYEDGLRDGPAGEWYADGARASQGAYEAGLREGPWTFWEPDGRLDEQRSGLYRAGERVEPLAPGQLIADS